MVEDVVVLCREGTVAAFQRWAQELSDFSVDNPGDKKDRESYPLLMNYLTKQLL